MNYQILVGLTLVLEKVELCWKIMTNKKLLDICVISGSKYIVTKRD